MQNRLNYTFPVPHNVFEEERFRKYRASIKLVYVWLLKLHNTYASKTDKWFWRSGEKLSQEIGIDIKTFRSAKKQLLKDGYIEVKNGEYNPEQNARHACYYRVNGFLNPGEKIPEIHKENEQDSFVQPEQPFVTKNAFEKKFDKGGEMYDWLIESGYLERISETSGSSVNGNGLESIISKKYPDIWYEIKEFIIMTEYKSMIPPRGRNLTPQ